MHVELKDINAIKPYPGNPRDNDGAVEAVMQSLREFGFRQPIVVDVEHVIIVGHTRHKAAQKLGLKQLPVHVATDLTEAQVRAYRLADNATNELAEWNYELLPIELTGLQEMNFDLGLLGFDDEELKRLMSGDVTEGLTDPDDIPAPPDAATTRPGDLWVLGNHRLLCGDSGKPADLDRLLGGARIHLVNTDPPYNVAVEPRSNNAIASGVSSFPASPPAKKAKGKAKTRAKDRPIDNDSVTDQQFDQLLDGWFGNIARVLEPGRGFYIWGGYGNCGSYPPVLKRQGLYFSQAIIWVKLHPVMNRKDFMGNHEWCFYGWREGAAHKFYGPHNVRDVWEVKKVPSQQTQHLTQKPVELAVRALQYSTVIDENVLDLFGGSGSTLIAAEQTQRRAFLMELDPLYVDIICDRYQRFSGKPAVLERTGKSPIPMGRREETMR
jgi:DNA modification methylase